ncbi:MAG TPA: hypothetical protein PLN69_04885 [bacterium]|nr:hypothetical protein [bacterium]
MLLRKPFLTTLLIAILVLFISGSASALKVGSSWDSVYGLIYSGARDGRANGQTYEVLRDGKKIGVFKLEQVADTTSKGVFYPLSEGEELLMGDELNPITVVAPEKTDSASTDSTHGRGIRDKEDKAVVPEEKKFEEVKANEKSAGKISTIREIREEEKTEKKQSQKAVAEQKKEPEKLKDDGRKPSRLIRDREKEKKESGKTEDKPAAGQGKQDAVKDKIEAGTSVTSKSATGKNEKSAEKLSVPEPAGKPEKTIKQESGAKTETVKADQDKGTKKKVSRKKTGKAEKTVAKKEDVKAKQEQKPAAKVTKKKLEKEEEKKQEEKPEKIEKKKKIEKQEEKPVAKAKVSRRKLEKIAERDSEASPAKKIEKKETPDKKEETEDKKDVSSRKKYKSIRQDDETEVEIVTDKEIKKDSAERKPARTIRQKDEDYKPGKEAKKEKKKKSEKVEAKSKKAESESEPGKKEVEIRNAKSGKKIDKKENAEKCDKCPKKQEQVKKVESVETEPDRAKKKKAELKQKDSAGKRRLKSKKADNEGDSDVKEIKAKKSARAEKTEKVTKKTESAVQEKEKDVPQGITEKKKKKRRDKKTSDEKSASKEKKPEKKKVKKEKQEKVVFEGKDDSKRFGLKKASGEEGLVESESGEKASAGVKPLREKDDPSPIVQSGIKPTDKLEAGTQQTQTVKKLKEEKQEKKQEPEEEWTAAKHLIRADDYFADRDYHKALENYSAALSLDPRSVKARRGVINSAQKLELVKPFKNGDSKAEPIEQPEEPMTEMDRVLQREDSEDLLDVSETYNNYGVFLLNEGNAEEAIEWIDKAIEQKPVEKSYYRNRAVAKFRSGDVLEAIYDAKKAMEMGDAKARDMLISMRKLLEEKEAGTSK